MSRRKQANPKSLRVSIDSISGETKLKENEHGDDSISQSQQENLASVFLKNMTNQSDLNENRKIYQLAKLTMEYWENNNKDIKKEPVESEEISKPKSRSPSQSSTSSDTIDVTTVTEETKPNQESKKTQRKRFNLNSQNDTQNSNSIIVNGKRLYRLIFTCENCGLRYSDQSTYDTHKQNYCIKRDQSRASPSDESSSAESSPSSSRSSTPNRLQTSVSNVQLLKSEIYKCNMCSFQSDKKSAMNRHSRIHLPQKRKQMEESSTAKIDVEDNTTDLQKSYCKECDIHFSSAKTYLHHRNNYCQKYQIIESIVPVQVQEPGTPEIKKPKVTSLPTPPPPPPSQIATQAPPIRMGDLVYLPVYKINEPKETTPIDLTVPKIQEETESSLPLDLSIKKPTPLIEPRGFQPVVKNPLLNLPFFYQNLWSLPTFLGPNLPKKEILEQESPLESPKNCNSPISTGVTSSLIEHPLVKKTLVELYGANFEILNLNDEIEENSMAKVNGINKNFYMCTACGYRGNTSRGVKQHGKLHLSTDEHFMIVNVTETHPYLVYSSLSDGELNKLLSKRNQIENDDTKAINNSKKGRILDYSKKLETETDESKSQTYCHKCNIQFQHVSNFLAHRKSYCKD